MKSTCMFKWVVHIITIMLERVNVPENFVQAFLVVLSWYFKM
jgi:hypothetical protein